MGKDIEEERLDEMYNEIFEDYKWYIGAIEDGEGNEDELFKSLIKNIKLFLREIERRNETLDDYPTLNELLRVMLGN
jgi:hypothetical protein